jgi:hypothetical protein
VDLHFVLAWGLAGSGVPDITAQPFEQLRIMPLISR